MVWGRSRTKPELRPINDVQERLGARDSSRFMAPSHNPLPTPLAEGYQREAMQELDRHPPKLIVLARSPTSWLQQPQTPPGFLQSLEKLLADRYERVGGWVAEEPGGRWQEPLSDQELANSSLVIFRRRSP